MQPGVMQHRRWIVGGRYEMNTELSSTTHSYSAYFTFDDSTTFMYVLRRRLVYVPEFFFFFFTGGELNDSLLVLLPSPLRPPSVVHTLDELRNPKPSSGSG